MDKDLKLIELFGLYGNLLTEHQKDLFNLYYECDLSLGEIAEIKSISRQSVNDGLKKAKEVLVSAEKKLGFAKKTREIHALLNSAEEGTLSAKDTAEKIINILEDN